MNNEQPISLCIIDDIKSVVDGLTAMNWSEHGIQVAGVSTNGEDGLELINRVRPDLIITDIRMPRMDGLTMVRSILAGNKACKVIIISGYADFDYAQQAVQLGAFNFVVKPFTVEDIMQAVLQAKEQIVQERSKLLSLRQMETRLRESMPVLRQEYFALLVSHRTPWEKAAKRWDFLNIDLQPQGFVVFLIEIDKFQERIGELSVHEVELIRFSLHNITEETIAEYTRCVVFRARHNRFLAVMNDSETLNPTRIAESVCRNIERYTKFTVSVGVGGSVEETSELPDSYRQADRALAYHLFTEGNTAIAYDELPLAGRQAPFALEYKDELLLALRSGNSQRSTAILHDIAASLQRMASQSNPDYLLSLYDELAASAVRTFYELVPFADIHPLVLRFKSMRGNAGIPLSALEQHLLAFCREGTDLVRNNSLSDGQRIIYESLNYIKGHLSQEVSVSECAAHVHLSNSYYSSLFKKITGMTVTQYVTTERILKAKQLLVEGVPVQEVAAAVGYEERRYFSEMFKKITGMTPSEFRAGYHNDTPKT